MRKETAIWLLYCCILLFCKLIVLPFDELIIDADDKAKICRSKKIDIFIDDSYKNCIQVANEGIKTYLMTTELNKNIDSGNIQRVYSWRDIKV